jgi:hypothetical protein
MEIEIDPDTKAVAGFMQSNIAASRLVGVAEGIARLAPLLWGRYAPEKVETLALAHRQVMNGSETSPPAANVSASDCSDAGDGFVGEVDAGEPT